VNQLVTAAIKIKLYPENFNREEGSKLSKAWNPRRYYYGKSRLKEGTKEMTTRTTG
jgi:hypothetical protein